jgi:hypothetical protein
MQGSRVAAAQQDVDHAGQYVFRCVVGEEVRELHGQLPSAFPLVPLKSRYDIPAEEDSRLLSPGCRSLTDRRAHGTRKGDIEQNLAGPVGVVSCEHVDGQESIKLPAM